MPRTIKVKPLATIKKNYEGSASEAARRYKEAIPGVSWHDRALEGQDLYETRMSDPAVLARRNTGIETVTDVDFRDAMTKKGAPVIASRMKDASDKQSRGYAPIRAAIDGMTIPDKTDDVDANIDNILKPIVHKMREAAGKE